MVSKVGLVQRNKRDSYCSGPSLQRIWYKNQDLETLCRGDFNLPLMKMKWKDEFPLMKKKWKDAFPLYRVLWSTFHLKCTDHFKILYQQFFFHCMSWLFHLLCILFLISNFISLQLELWHPVQNHRPDIDQPMAESDSRYQMVTKFPLILIALILKSISAVRRMLKYSHSPQMTRMKSNQSLWIIPP